MLFSRKAELSATFCPWRKWCKQAHLAQTKTSLTRTFHLLYIWHKRTGRAPHVLAFISRENIRASWLGKASSCLAKLWLTITGIIFLSFYFGKDVNILWIPSCLCTNKSELRQLIWQISDVHITYWDSTCNYVIYSASLRKFNNRISSSIQTRYRPSFLGCQKVKTYQFFIIKRFSSQSL